MLRRSKHLTIEVVAPKEEVYCLGGKGVRCEGLTTLPPSCADCLEIWELQLSGTLRASPGLYRYCFTLLLLYTFIVRLW